MLAGDAAARRVGQQKACFVAALIGETGRGVPDAYFVGARQSLSVGILIDRIPGLTKDQRIIIQAEGRAPSVAKLRIACSRWRRISVIYCTRQSDSVGGLIAHSRKRRGHRVVRSP